MKFFWQERLEKVSRIACVCDSRLAFVCHSRCIGREVGPSSRSAQVVSVLLGRTGRCSALKCDGVVAQGRDFEKRAPRPL